MPAFFFGLLKVNNCPCYNIYMQSRMRLLKRLSDKEFLTGTTLGQELGIGRAAVHKHISLLRASGLPVDSVPGKGYRLAKGVIALNGEAIAKGLDEKTRAEIRKILVETDVDSTNNYLLRLSRPDSVHGMVCVAEAQSSGRGQRGRQWVASPYRNLLMSLGWVYEVWPQGISGMSIAVGIRLVDALKSIGVDKLGLKWPNDIVHGNKKLGGVLIEVSGESPGPCSLVIGVGINVHISERDGGRIEQPWTDLVNGLGCNVDRNQLAASCLTQLHLLLSRYVLDGFEYYKKRWRELDVLYGNEVVVTHLDGGGKVMGKAVDLDNTGALKIRQKSGKEIVCYHGDVRVRQQ